MANLEKEAESLKELYKSNKNFKEFCDKAIERKEATSLDALFKHKMIEHVANYYRELAKRYYEN